MNRIFSAIISTFCILFLSISVLADEKTEAKKHFEAGLSLQKAEDFKGAAVEFEMSVRLYETKSGLYNLANCYRAIHRYSEALDTFRLLNSRYEGKMDLEMKEDVDRQIREIETLVASLTINVDTEGADIEVDGNSVGKSPLAGPILLGPGEHSIIVSLDSYEKIETTIKTVSGEKKTESFTMKQLPATVSIKSSVDGADVIMDEKLIGQTPLAKEVELEPGKHTVRLTREGYEPSEQTLEMKAGESLSLDFSLVEIKPEIVPVQPAAPVKPVPEKKKGMSGAFWTMFSMTLGIGATAGAFYGIRQPFIDSFKSDKSEYEDLVRDAQNNSSNMDMAQNLDDEYSDMESSKESAEIMDQIAFWTAMTAAAFAAATVIIMSVDLAGMESESESEPAEAAVTLSPTGVIVNF